MKTLALATLALSIYCWALDHSLDDALETHTKLHTNRIAQIEQATK
jgi:hypothetical protein